MDELRDRTPPKGDATSGLEARLEEIERAAPGVAPIVESAVHDPGSSANDVGGRMEDPMKVVLDQREAMARAIELRDDESLPADERARWANAVEHLALARREAKTELAERRLEDPTEETWMDAGFQSEMEARARDRDPGDLDARGAPPTSPPLAPDEDVETPDVGHR